MSKVILVKNMPITAEPINPELTKNFVRFMEDTSKGGIYRVGVQIGDKVLPIDVFPTVFPPKSDYSASSKSVFEAFGNLKGLEVADIGSGSGIEAIVAKLAGATHVDAVDISPAAVECTRHNVVIHELTVGITVYHSDLFKSLPREKYDLIIANLPIVNFSAHHNAINDALYDAGLKMHKRLLVEAKSFLKERGVITFTHANLQSKGTSVPDYDFVLLEKIIHTHGYKIKAKSEHDALGYQWINYKICLDV